MKTVGMEAKWVDACLNDNQGQIKSWSMQLAKGAPLAEFFNVGKDESWDTGVEMKDKMFSSLSHEKNAKPYVSTLPNVQGSPFSLGPASYLMDVQTITNYPDFLADDETVVLFEGEDQEVAENQIPFYSLSYLGPRFIDYIGDKNLPQTGKGQDRSRLTVPLVSAEKMQSTYSKFAVEFVISSRGLEKEARKSFFTDLVARLDMMNFRYKIVQIGQIHTSTFAVLFSPEFGTSDSLRAHYHWRANTAFCFYRQAHNRVHGSKFPMLTQNRKTMDKNGLQLHFLIDFEWPFHYPQLEGYEESEEAQEASHHFPSNDNSISTKPENFFEGCETTEVEPDQEGPKYHSRALDKKEIFLLTAYYAGKRFPPSAQKKLEEMLVEIGEDSLFDAFLDTKPEPEKLEAGYMVHYSFDKTTSTEDSFPEPETKQAEVTAPAPRPKGVGRGKSIAKTPAGNNGGGPGPQSEAAAEARKNGKNPASQAQFDDRVNDEVARLTAELAALKSPKSDEVVTQDPQKVRVFSNTGTEDNQTRMAEFMKVSRSLARPAPAAPVVVGNSSVKPAGRGLTLLQKAALLL
jgi:hypothetical protein